MISNYIACFFVLSGLICFSDIILITWENIAESKKGIIHFAFLTTTILTFPYVSAFKKLLDHKEDILLTIVIVFLFIACSAVKTISLSSYFLFTIILWYEPQIRIQRKRVAKIRLQCKTFEEVDAFLQSKGCLSEQAKKKYFLKKCGFLEAREENDSMVYDYQATVEKLLTIKEDA